MEKGFDASAVEWYGWEKDTSSLVCSVTLRFIKVPWSDGSGHKNSGFAKLAADATCD